MHDFYFYDIEAVAPSVAHDALDPSTDVFCQGLLICRCCAGTPEDVVWGRTCLP